MIVRFEGDGNIDSGCHRHKSTAGKVLNRGIKKWHLEKKK